MTRRVLDDEWKTAQEQGSPGPEIFPFGLWLGSAADPKN